MLCCMIELQLQISCRAFQAFLEKPTGECLTLNMLRHQFFVLLQLLVVVPLVPHGCQCLQLHTQSMLLKKPKYKSALACKFC